MSNHRNCVFSSSRILTCGGIALLASLVFLFAGSFSLADVTYSDNPGADEEPIPSADIATGTGGVGDVTFRIEGSTPEFSKNITGDGNVSKTDDGTLTLTGANTYSGTTTISGGTLTIKNNFTSSSGLAGSGTLKFYGNNLYFGIVSSSASSFNGTINLNDSDIQKTSRIILGIGNSASNTKANVNLPEATLVMNGNTSGKYFSELAFNTGESSLTIGTLNGNAYSRIMTTNSDKDSKVYSNLTVGSGVFAGEIGRIASANDLRGGNWSFSNHVNLTKTGDGTLTLSGPLYYYGSTDIKGGTLAITNSDFASTNSLTGSGTLKLAKNEMHFNIYNSTVSDFAGTIQLFDTNLTAKSRVYLSAVTYSWNSNAVQKAFSATDLSLPKATLEMNGNTSQKCYSELAFYSGKCNLTIGTLNGNEYSRILTTNSTQNSTDYCTLTVGSGEYAGEIGRNESGSLIYVNHINVTKANKDDTENGGELTLSGPLYYKGETVVKGGTLTINSELKSTSGVVVEGGKLILNGNVSYTGETEIQEGGTLQFVNTKTSDKKYFNTSTALDGSGTLDIVGNDKSWLFFAINSTSAQNFSGLMNVSGKLTLVKDTNLGYATLHVNSSSYVTFNGESKVKSLTVKALNTESRSKVRVSHSDTGIATLTVGSGTVNGDLGELGGGAYYNTVDLVKVSDGSEDGGTLTINGNNYYTGKTKISGGTLKLSGSGTLGTGAVTIGNNATLEIAYDNPATPVAIPSLTMAENSAFKVTSGTVTFSSQDVLLNNLSGENGTISVSGVLTLNNDEQTKYAGAINASNSTVKKTGDGTLQIYTAAKDMVDAQSFVVSSGRLDMMEYFTGSLEIGDGTGAGATFSPGNSVGPLEVTGNFTLHSGSILLLEFDDTGADSLDVLEGTTTFESGSYVTLELEEGASVSPDQQILFHLPAGIDTFDNATLSYPSFLTDVSYDSGTGILSATVMSIDNPVPEPSTWALLALGAAGLMYWRKRK